MTIFSIMQLTASSFQPAPDTSSWVQQRNPLPTSSCWSHTPASRRCRFSYVHCGAPSAWSAGHKDQPMTSPDTVLSHRECHKTAEWKPESGSVLHRSFRQLFINCRAASLCSASVISKPSYKNMEPKPHDISSATLYFSIEWRTANGIYRKGDGLNNSLIKYFLSFQHTQESRLHPCGREDTSEMRNSL